MKRVMYKKSVLVLVLTALLFLALFLFGFSVNGQERAYAAQSDYTLDADQLRFDGRPADLAKKDVNNILGMGADNKMIETGVSKASPTIKVIASGGFQIHGGNSDALRIEVRLLFNRWPDLGYGGVSNDATYLTLKIYNSADKELANPLATSTQYASIGNFVRTFQLAPEQVCNNRGKLQDFVIGIECDGTSWSTAVIIDYVKIVYTQHSIFEAGECITGKNPENVADERVIWGEAEGYADTYIDGANYGGFYSYVDNPAMVELVDKRFPDVECITESDGTQTLRMKNMVFALNLGKISPDGYEQFLMDVLLTDKRAMGNHTLYLYGANPERFVDEEGNPVGYAAMVTVESYEQGYHNKFILEGEDVQKLVDSDGMISTVYVLYHGNTLDTATETVGLRNGSQIWINRVQLLTASEIASPEIGTEYARYDVSDLFPVGQGGLVTMKSGTSGSFVSNAVLANKQVGELSLTVNVDAGENVAFLFGARGRAKTNEHLSGGILFYLSPEKVEIVAHKSGSVESFSVVPTGVFTGDTLVKIECIPYYMNSVQAGFYCAVWAKGEKLTEGYFAADDLTMGDMLHLCYEAKGQDFAVKLGAAKTEGVLSATELMNVQVNAEPIIYSLDKTDVPLSLYWYNTGFDELSDVECDGSVAWINQEVKRVQFTGNGEIKVKFSVTNAFGTFESKELVLLCEDALITQKNVENVYENGWFIALHFLPLAVFGGVWAVMAMKKARPAKKSEELSE